MQNGLNDADLDNDVPFGVKSKLFVPSDPSRRKPPKFGQFWTGLRKFLLDFASALVVSLVNIHKSPQSPLKAPASKTLKLLRTFLGLASFYRKYVLDFAMIATPLTVTMKKGNPNEITCDEVRECAFQELKRQISHQLILKFPDVSEPFILQTDTSHTGISTVLLQEDSAGENLPIAFAS